jgi:3-hydroxybutyryl-CoA dehydratase
MTSGLRVGRIFTVRRQMSAHQIRMFAELTSDLGPQHLDPGRPVAHGLYLASLVSLLGSDVAIVGHRFSLELTAPAYAGDEVEVEVEIQQVRAAGAFGDWIQATAVFRNQTGALLARGDFSGFARPATESTAAAAWPGEEDSR